MVNSTLDDLQADASPAVVVDTPAGTPDGDPVRPQIASIVGTAEASSVFLVGTTDASAGTGIGEGAYPGLARRLGDRRG